jgi:hypothetical protein
MNENYGMTLMFIAANLCDKYDEWKNDSNLMNIVDLNTNTICIGLKQMYPLISDKIRQCMALAFSMYFFILISEVFTQADDKMLDEHMLDEQNLEAVLYNIGLD